LEEQEEEQERGKEKLDEREKKRQMTFEKYRRNFLNPGTIPA